jgi:hypothetical protein
MVVCLVYVISYDPESIEAVKDVYGVIANDEFQLNLALVVVSFAFEIILSSASYVHPRLFFVVNAIVSLVQATPYAFNRRPLLVAFLGNLVKNSVLYRGDGLSFRTRVFVGFVFSFMILNTVGGFFMRYPR